MKFLKASSEIIPIPAPTDAMAVYKHLERIGRVCYKSEDKINDESCLKFLANIYKRKHWAMLEHYPFVIYDRDRILLDALTAFYSINDAMVQSKLSFVKSNMLWFDDMNHAFISGSATAFNYLYDALMASPDGVSEEDLNVYVKFMRRMYLQFPKIFTNPENVADVSEFHDAVDHERWELWSQDDLMKIDDPNVAMHLYMTAKFICDRGVTHEIVRHRPCSYAQESTRYCNYGKLGCQFIIPDWFQDFTKERLLDQSFVDQVSDSIMAGEMTISKLANLCGISEGESLWVYTMFTISIEYEQLVGTDMAWTPQQARSILPNSVKTEIVMTANIPEYGHFFEMRVPKTAHPQMREVAIPLYHTAKLTYGDKIPNLDAAAAE